MGNGVSCLAANSGRPAAGTATVFTLDEGAAREVEAPVTAAEVMLEALGQVVARAEEVARTRRASGILLAEEELRAGEAYLLLPAGKKGSRLTDRQMDLVLEALGRKKMKNKKKKKNQMQQALFGRRVFPEAACGHEVAEEDVCKMEVSRGSVTRGPCRRGQGRWRPTLDTIHESTCA